MRFARRKQLHVADLTSTLPNCRFIKDLIIETESLSLTGLLRYAENNLLNTYSLAHLKTVACARVGLYSVAKVILDILEKGELPSESETLAIELAQKLCTERHALIFLLKELVRRRRDLDVLTQLQNTDVYALTWLGKTVLQHSQVKLEQTQLLVTSNVFFLEWQRRGS